MTIAEKIQELLIGAAAVTALVPAARIRVPGPWQNLARPYVIHFPVSPAPGYTHGGLMGFRQWDYQVSVFADSYSTGEAAAIAIRDALVGVHALASPVTDGVTIFWKPGLWYVGSEQQADQSPVIEHFIVSLDVHEAL